MKSILLRNSLVLMIMLSCLAYYSLLAWRPEWLGRVVAGVPLSIIVALILFALFVLATWCYALAHETKDSA